MAQSFVGSNNINLLAPRGQFGTRLQVSRPDGTRPGWQCGDGWHLALPMPACVRLSTSTRCGRQKPGPGLPRELPHTRAACACREARTQPALDTSTPCWRGAPAPSSTRQTTSCSPTCPTMARAWSHAGALLRTASRLCIPCNHPAGALRGPVQQLSKRGQRTQHRICRHRAAALPLMGASPASSTSMSAQVHACHPPGAGQRRGGHRHRLVHLHPQLQPCRHLRQHAGPAGRAATRAHAGKLHLDWCPPWLAATLPAGGLCTGIGCTSRCWSCCKQHLSAQLPQACQAQHLLCCSPGTAASTGLWWRSPPRRPGAPTP